MNKLNSQYKLSNLDNAEDAYDSGNSDYEIEDEYNRVFNNSKKNIKKQLPITITKVAFSYTNRSFIVASTEGIFFYSLDVDYNFGSLVLNDNVTPDMCLVAFKNKNYEKAIIFCIYLNLGEILDIVINSINSDRINLICSKLPINVVMPLILFFSKRYKI